MADGTVGADFDDGPPERVALPVPLGAAARTQVEVEPDDGWTAPAVSAARAREPWSVLALAAAVIGLVPVTWPVPILSVLAIAFGLVGVRNCQLDRIWRNRWMGVLALALGLATLIAALLLTSFGKLHFLPFWTTSD